MEMSVNVLVGIILGIVMFGAAIFIFFNLMGRSGQMSQDIDDQTKAKIEQALDSGDPIYVPATMVQSQKGYATFWIGIRNIGSETDRFKVNIKPLAPIPNGFGLGNVAYFKDAYSISAKGNVFVPVVVNTKGFVQDITLLVNITKNSTDGPTPKYEQYMKPKIITVENG
jgi:hypothetical protein